MPTVITNSPNAVRRLAASSPVGMVRKSLGPNTVTEGGQITVAFTHHLTAADLTDVSGVDATATQVQHWVNKTHEARVIVVGERMFTILIRAGSDASQVDWRADYPALSYEWVDTSPEIEKELRGYLAEMGLVYAAVDFAIDGRWVFPENLNPTARDSISGLKPTPGHRSPPLWPTCSSKGHTHDLARAGVDGAGTAAR